MKVIQQVVFAGLLLLSACAPVVVGNPGSPRPPDEGPYATLAVPRGHLPPPGGCRIWIPGRPTGHQPPPGPCPVLAYEVPPGGWLLSRQEYNPEYVKVSVYHYNRPGTVEVIRFYDVETGRLVWERSPYEY